MNIVINKDPAFEELKGILFRCAKCEMEGYLQAREKWGEKPAEVQRQRYISLYQVIDRANLNREYQAYKVRA